MKKILIFLIFGFISITLYKAFIFAQYDQTPFSWDQAMHMVLASQYNTLLKAREYHEFATIYRFYPPLTYLLFIPFLNIFGTTRLAALIFNSLYIGITVILIYHLVLKTSSRRAALLASGLTWIFLVFGWFTSIWDLMTEIPLACTILLFFTFFRYMFKQNSINTINVLILGLLTGLVGMTKGSGFVYIFVPILFAAYKLLRKKFWYFIIFAGLLLLTNYWYLYNFEAEIKEAYFRNVFTGIHVKKDVQGLAGLKFYISNIIQTKELVILIFTVIIFGTQHLKNQQVAQVNIAILASLFFTFISIGFGPNKDARYMHSWTLLVFLFIGWWLGTKTGKQVYTSIITIIFLLWFYKILQLPLPTSDRYLLNELPQIIESTKFSKIYYFFADDSPYFNYANLDLLRERKVFLELNLINRNSIDMIPENSGECKIEGAAGILVYSYLPFENKYPNSHVSLSQYCTDIDINNNCKKIQTVSNDTKQEKMDIYSCSFNSI